MLGLGSSIVTQGFVEGAPAPLLLDTYTGAAAAYSLRKLSNNYTGSAIEVSDGTNTQDIGFDANGGLDTSALATFCGSNNGTITKWYDQSGNSNDAIPPTSNSRPKIYDGTDGVEEENSKPAMQLDNIDDGFDLTTNIADGTHYTFVVHALNSSNNSWGIFRESTSNAIVPIALNGSTGAISFGYTLDSLYKDDQSAFSGTRDNLHDLYTSAGQSLTTMKFSGQEIDGFFSRANFYHWGAAQEVIIFDSDQDTNRTAIQTNINDFYSIF